MYVRWGIQVVGQNLEIQFCTQQCSASSLGSNRDYGIMVEYYYQDHDHIMMKSL